MHTIRVVWYTAVSLCRLTCDAFFNTVEVSMQVFNLHHAVLVLSPKKNDLNTSSITVYCTTWFTGLHTLNTGFIPTSRKWCISISSNKATGLHLNVHRRLSLGCQGKQLHGVRLDFCMNIAFASYYRASFLHSTPRWGEEKGEGSMGWRTRWCGQPKQMTRIMCLDLAFDLPPVPLFSASSSWTILFPLWRLFWK